MGGTSPCAAFVLPALALTGFSMFPQSPPPLPPPLQTYTHQQAHCEAICGAHSMLRQRPPHRVHSLSSCIACSLPPPLLQLTHIHPTQQAKNAQQPPHPVLSFSSCTASVSASAGAVKPPPTSLPISRMQCAQNLAAATPSPCALSSCTAF
jgi:hypothetical protein